MIWVGVAFEGYKRRRKRWNRMAFGFRTSAIDRRFETALCRNGRLGMGHLEWSIADDSRVEVLSLVLGRAPSG